MRPITRLRKEWKDICTQNKASLAFYNALNDLPLPEGVDKSCTFADAEIILFPKRQDIQTQWIALIKGPPDSPFQNARFQLNIQISIQYPHMPPNVHFVTPICHPNVHFKTGEICQDILKDNWTPSWALESVCRAIVALLGSPEASSPLNCDAGNLLRANDIRGYWSLARMFTLEYAEMLPQESIESKNIKVETVTNND